MLERLRECVAELGAAPRVLELGAGVTMMFSRLRGWNVLSDASCTAVDTDAEALAAARSLLPGSNVELEHDDLFGYLDRTRKTFDLVLANAVLDLVDVPTLLRGLWRRMRPGGLVYFTINFDGDTIFLPEARLDAEVFRLYHLSMDTRTRGGRPAGDSKSGRRLLEQVPAGGGRLLAAGSSDWVVYPEGSSYPEDEAYFLHHIVRTIELELTGHPELDPTAFAEWGARRHREIEEHRLCYVAHQLDVLARAPE